MQNSIQESDEYNALREAMNDEDKIMEKIQEILETTPDKSEAERIINEKYLPLVNKTMERTRSAMGEWRKREKEELKTIEKEMNDSVEEEDEE